jgi:hypothetical protein
LEGEDVGVGSEDEVKRFRKRSQPPSRHRVDGEGQGGSGIRRQRSYPNLYEEDRRDNMDEEVRMHGGDVVDTSEQADLLQPAQAQQK